MSSKTFVSSLKQETFITLFLHFLLLLHATPLSEFSCLLQSIIILYIVGFSKRINVYYLFLLLIPDIVFLTKNDDTEFIENASGFFSWIKIYIPFLKPYFSIGPVAFSVRFIASSAVVIRVFREMIFASFQIYLWLSVVLISIIGLYVSLAGKMESVGGLTIGLRIALTIGTLFMPKLIDINSLKNQIFQILATSSVLMILGLLNNHWVFIFAGLAPLIIFSSRANMAISITVYFTIFLFLFFNYTFTLKFTVILSLLFLSVPLKIFDNKVINFMIKYLLIAAPLYLVFMSITGILDTIFTSIKLESLSDKIFEDRIPLWLQTSVLILSSDFFIVDAGRDIILLNYGVIGESSWGAGAHNIFLEMARQLGSFSTIILIYFIFNIFFEIFSSFKKFDNVIKKIILSLFSVYLVYGMTGNSLVYDGVGFLFWIIIGQIHKLRNEKN